MKREKAKEKCNTNNATIRDEINNNHNNTNLNTANNANESNNNNNNTNNTTGNLVNISTNSSKNNETITSTNNSSSSTAAANGKTKPKNLVKWIMEEFEDKNLDKVKRTLLVTLDDISKGYSKLSFKHNNSNKYLI